MSKGTGAPGEVPDALEWLGSYRPASVDPALWATIQRFVWECVQRLQLDRERSSAWRVVRELARIAGWAVEQGLPLDVEMVLDPDTVERFITVGLADDRSRATYRGVLRRVGPALTRRAPWPPKAATVAFRQVATPYRNAEVAQLRADANMQSTPARARAARALLALGLGAGLDGRWLARVTAADVTVGSGGLVLVRVGEPAARTVPVLEEWEAEVADLANTAGADFLVGGRSTAKNRAGQLAASITIGNGHPRFSASRLRSTWLVTHLAMGTRLPELARAAGLQGATVLSDLLAYVPALAKDEASVLLRGRR